MVAWPPVCVSGSDSHLCKIKDYHRDIYPRPKSPSPGSCQKQSASRPGLINAVHSDAHSRERLRISRFFLLMFLGVKSPLIKESQHIIDFHPFT